MANYDAAARTNSFRVKDLEAFKAHLGRYGLTATTFDNPYAGDIVISNDKPDEDPNQITLFSYGGWPSLDEDSTASRLDLDDISDDEWQKLDLRATDINQIIAEHLAEDEVAILVQVGQEKMRYLGGTALAVNAAGETRRIDLDDIVDLAAELTVSGRRIDHPSH